MFTSRPMDRSLCRKFCGILWGRRGEDRILYTDAGVGTGIETGTGDGESWG